MAAPRIRANGVKMFEPVTYPRLAQLLEAGAQLVDVLPEREYRETHLPGAMNIPLRVLDDASAARLERTRAVVVYCHDGL